MTQGRPMGTDVDPAVDPEEPEASERRVDEATETAEPDAQPAGDEPAEDETPAADETPVVEETQEDEAPSDEAPSDEAPSDEAPSDDDTEPEREPEPEPEPVEHASAAPTDHHVPPTTPERTSPMDVFPDEERHRRWPRLLGLGAAVVVVLGGLYVGALWLWSDRVPPGATVAGVEIGGLGAEAAVARLDEDLATATTEPLAVAAGDKRTTLDPVAAGLVLDSRATVDEVTGFGLEPARLWRHVFGAGDVPAVTTVDDEALDAAVATLADSLETLPVDGTVVFVDGQAQGTDAVEGTTLDADAARELLVAEWLTAPRPVELPTTVEEPDITSEEVDAAITEVARPLADAPITVAVADQLAELPVDVVTSAATFAPEDGELVLQLDGEALVEAVVARTTDLLTSPADATFAFNRGVPVIVPGTAGTTLDPEALADAVAEAGTGEDRTARVELVQVDPAASTAELEALGVVEIVSEFSTPLTSEPRRTTNIANGASKVNGTLVRPDEVFSLTEALGPIDGAHGYVQAGAIINGEHTDAWGGGLSQVSTTTYNAAFFAGFEDVEHTPHSEWFARYPEGREATIFTGSIDLKWRNNTPYGALLQAWVAEGRVHVRVWSTPHWTVETTTSGRSDVVQPTTVYSQSDTCEPQSAGNPGFRVRVTRTVSRDGVEPVEEAWTTTYRPQNAVICGPPPGEEAATATPTPTP